MSKGWRTEELTTEVAVADLCDGNVLHDTRNRSRQSETHQEANTELPLRTDLEAPKHADGREAEEKVCGDCKGGLGIGDRMYNRSWKTGAGHSSIPDLRQRSTGRKPERYEDEGCNGHGDHDCVERKLSFLQDGRFPDDA